MLSKLFSSQKQISSLKNIQNFIDTYAKKDNWHQIDRATGNLGYGWIHYALIRVFHPQGVLCIGSRYGYAPAICALACKDNQGGCVDFVDAGYDQADPRHNIKLGANQSVHWGGVGFWKKTDVSKHFGQFGLTPYISFFLTTSNLFAASHPIKQWQYIYLDGDHSYEGVRSDFNLFFPKLSKGGCIVFHDIYTKHLGGMPYGVHRFWKELKSKKRYHCLEVPGACGVGIIQT